MVLARIRAQVVLPTPRGPQKRKECASCRFLIAFFRVVVICCWPTTVEKSWGRYFLAETINLSIEYTPLANLRHPGDFSRRQNRRRLIAQFLIFPKNNPSKIWIINIVK